MPPVQHLPIDPTFESVEQYVGSLLAFVTSNQLFQHLCGGVHILDFLTKEPDLYSTILPQAWRAWFQLHDMKSILDLLMHEDQSRLQLLRISEAASPSASWRGGPVPPICLLDYVITVRKHALQRVFSPRLSGEQSLQPLPRHVAVGMKPKKIHEVQCFSRYITDLSASIPDLNSQNIIVDLGSGMNYLGRTLASPPYNIQVVALESKHRNISGAQAMDLTARLAKKEQVLRNKKLFRQGQDATAVSDHHTPVTNEPNSEHGESFMPGAGAVQPPGRIQYIETEIKNGNLSKVIRSIESGPISSFQKPQFMIVSLHSCGNLLHHGLRSLIINPSVKAVALIGCCYNLVTERLGPPTFKLHSLRNSNQRLKKTSSACDPHGFPMSERLLFYRHPCGEGVRMNITARMMACQAPQNWSARDCESFFTRHFYRALLQRILLDCGLVDDPCEEEPRSPGVEGGSSRNLTSARAPITIGSLRKTCYESFGAYFHGAASKLIKDSGPGDRIAQGLQGLTDEQVTAYEESYKAKKKELSIIWSLMAFSASLVESVIVVDRWLYLKEQSEVKQCWVEPVFEYAQSPRNLVVVGIKG